MLIREFLSFFLTLCITSSAASVSVPQSEAVRQQPVVLPIPAAAEASLPVYLPQTLPEYRADSDMPIQYFFGMEASDNRYEIQIYDISSRTPPESIAPEYLPQSCRLGAVSGTRGAEDGAPAVPEVPAGTQRKTLLPDVEAELWDNGASACWERNGWKFYFAGTAGQWSSLEKFAAHWDNISPVAPQGRVQVYPDSVYFLWSDGGCRYCFEACNTDLLSALSAFSSMQKAGAAA